MLRIVKVERNSCMYYISVHITLARRIYFSVWQNEQM